MATAWFVSSQGLVRARQALLISQDELATKSGVSVRSIRAYERKEERVRFETLQCLAKALSVDVKAIARLRAEERGTDAKSAPQPASPPSTSVLPPRTQLETLVDLEHAAGIRPPPLATPRGPAEVLTAKRLQDVLTAYALHEGARFSLTGRVKSMRGIAPDEAKLLGSKGGVAARFHVLKDVVPGEVVGVTVHTAERAHTERLQKLYESEVTLTVRVVLVPGEPRDDGPGFSSFITRLAVKRPWTFLVEDVAEAETKPTGTKPKARKKAK
jgi:transcriptional regulator with XRE-family HTH domain